MDKQKNSLLFTLMLIAILSAGAYFRFIGLDWDQDYHLHPDERFLTMVETSVVPVNSLMDFFDTENSTLNPHNLGYGFYVYGTLPLFIVRYIAQWLGMTGYSEVYLVGRFASASIDLLTVLLVYLIAYELYRKRMLAIIAAAFSAFAVMQIQLSHFFTVDNFANFFATFAFYMAVRVLRSEIKESAAGSNRFQGYWRYSGWIKENWGVFFSYVFFGVALGMAMASKISTAPLAILLPTAAGINYFKFHYRNDVTDNQQHIYKIFVVINIFVAGVLSFLVFRICQPYAFTGPGFFGLNINPRWIDNLKDLSAQASGDVDFPPALQWARRPLWFSWYNMVFWGMGLPFGLIAWLSFIWMGWRMARNHEWIIHSLLWGWTIVYFIWQSLNPTSSMRYQIIVYPTLAIIAAWGLIQAYDLTSSISRSKIKTTLIPGFIIVLSLIPIGSTGAWAFAFTRIYTRPVTRLEASYWIYQNVPGPINLRINNQSISQNQVLPFRLGRKIKLQEPLLLAFKARFDGVIKEIVFSHISSSFSISDNLLLQAMISEDKNIFNSNMALDETLPLAIGTLKSDFPSGGDGRGNEYRLSFDRSFPVTKGKIYYLKLSINQPIDELMFTGPMMIGMEKEDNSYDLQPLPEPVEALQQGENQTVTFTPNYDGILEQIYIPHIVDLEGHQENKSIEISITESNDNNQILAKARHTNIFEGGEDGRGYGYWFKLDQPLQLTKQQTLTLRISHTMGPGAIAVYGSRQANESTWDDAIPLTVQRYSPFDYFNGVYRTDLNFEMYWDDNEEKRQRFEIILDQADYIFITSNRQWGTTVRVPERYPLTTFYYRNLLGCPPDKEVLWCYQVAEPGMFEGRLGFELIKVFKSEPNLGQLQFNTQFAEEAFSVYDHPKVFIFKKKSDYSPQRVRDLFWSVDLSQVMHITPADTPAHPANLMLPSDRFSVQQAGGTWSELFSRNALYNRYPGLGVILWYVVISLLGWVVYPFLRLAMKGLSDRGYPLVKLAAMIMIAYLVWLLGSLEIPFNKMTISIVIAILLVINLFLFYMQREDIHKEWKNPKAFKYILLVEGIALAFFMFFLLIRLGNPDLWHPYKGGEKPMEFSFFNAVLKSTTFPPYDPWFSGGYINYYYYGYVLVGVLVKWLGIIPSIAYNFILPTLFSMVAMSAFSVGWNLLSTRAVVQVGEKRDEYELIAFPKNKFYAGISAAIGLLVLGNLGTVRMIWRGLQRLVAPGGTIEGANFITQWVWSVQGLSKFLSGNSLPYGPGEWYWIPSRVIPGEPITEFPFFTFLYADLHAHLIALPITIFSLAWIISVVQRQWQWDDYIGKRKWLNFSASMLLGGLIIGALRPVNTWDLPTYLTLGVLAVFYSAIRYYRKSNSKLEHGSETVSDTRYKNENQPCRSWLAGISSALILVLLSFLLYRPFAYWYGAGYNAVDIWKGDHTPFWSYITHWGLFLLVISSWMAWETIDWMKKTPLSFLNRLRPYKVLLQVFIVFTLALCIGLYILGIHVAWLIILLGLWAIIIILQPDQSDEKRLVLFWFGSSLALSFVVEFLVLRGDIGRMNTVFKFYLQAWTLMSISAAVCLIWLFQSMSRGWLRNLRTFWRLSFSVIVFGAALFPLMGGLDKIRDRMAKDAPNTLDGMSYMAYSTYTDKEYVMDLSQDYRAIIWMQDNIQGSPTIVEGNTPEYRWGSRFTIYTGLPGVVGWNWHERQQRALTPSEWVTDRIAAIAEFYRTNDISKIKMFLSKYDVGYIILGQLEKAYYPGQGLDKFSKLDGSLWKEVYHEDDTYIYQVIK